VLPPTGTATATPTLSPFSPTPTPGQCTDNYEPDGVAETAKTILIGQTQTHSICPATDADWVRFYGRAGKVYTIRTSNLGIGLDTFMFLFDSNATTILAQNDDGGDGVASRIDFYPQLDDWYFVQVKNAGDLGLPEMTYDLSLAVVPGVPQPGPTATGIIAPPVTVTSISGGQATPTTFVQPTRPPVSTPTQGAIEPTPPEAATAVPTSPVKEPPATPTEEPTSVVPGVPNTGAVAPIIDTTQSAPRTVRLASILFRIFYDGDHNDTFSAGEGIRGVSVFFLDSQANLAPTGSLTTKANGQGGLRIPITPQRIYIPYFAINIPLTRFPERELHSIWLPSVRLPDRVP
jgi:Bacterial pre-peptidase C-terminal domain